MSRRLLSIVLVIVVSQVLPLSRLLPLLPGHDTSVSPSSDALMGQLPLPVAAHRFDALSHAWPQAPGVVVAHASADEAASAYFVLSVHLWPRPVSLVACEPGPSALQFRVGPQSTTFRWRVDLRPRQPAPLAGSTGTFSDDPAELCRWTAGNSDATPRPAVEVTP